ncbi:MAG: hypothetical protein RI948_836 [Bacteroidota bacterium]|jgi:hypothetical protein
MRLFLHKILITFIAFALFICVGLIFIALSTHFTLKLEQKSFGHMTHWGSSFARIDEFESWTRQKPSKARGLIIGSSTAYRNINPHILSKATNIDWFNYGSSGQPPKISYFLLQDAFQKTKLAYVLLDIYPDVIALEGLESAHDLVYNSRLHPWLKTQLVIRYPNTKLLLRYLYFYTKRVIPSKAHIIYDATNGTYTGKGFVCSNQPGLQHYNKPSKTQVIKDFQTLHDIAALCKSNGAQLILNINPELGKSFRLAPIYRSFKVITAPDFHNPSHFYDTHHMTCEGANQYSQGLKKRLVKLLEK